MIPCFFVSDLHGHPDRYQSLFAAVEREGPAALFLGGDLLPSAGIPIRSLDLRHRDFVHDFLAPGFERLRTRLKDAYPKVFLILGNDDARFEEAAFMDVASRNLWRYIHQMSACLRDYRVYGYSFVPPTPFLLKDWERYDVSRYVDPGSVSPEEGRRSVPISEEEMRHATIQGDLERLARDVPMDRAVFLFHAPPYRTKLDRAALDGQMIDHVPLDVNVGSIAVRRFIERRQPLLTLHGHIHESARLTGSWRDRLGRTHMFSAAHDGAELALVRFDLEDLSSARRELL